MLDNCIVRTVRLGDHLDRQVRRAVDVGLPDDPAPRAGNETKVRFVVDVLSQDHVQGLVYTLPSHRSPTNRIKWKPRREQIS